MISLKGIEKLAIDNSPAILTAIGVVGTIGTAVLSARGHIKAMELLRSAEVDSYNNTPDLTRKDVAKIVYKSYIPPVVCGALTVAAIISANHIGTKRTAALAAAYTISDKAFTEYREKVVERMGEAKERAVRDEIAQDRVSRTPGAREVIISGTDVLCFDEFSGRYFKSDVQSIREAENDTNREMLHSGYQTLSDFYERLGLAATSASEEVGWSSDKKLEVEMSTTLSEDGRPCLSINFSVAPSRDYRNFH